MNGSRDQFHVGDADWLEIALRAYVPTNRKPGKWSRANLGLSEWSLIFDCETETDEAQTLRFGVYQVRKGMNCGRPGISFYSNVLTNDKLVVFAAIRRR